jgi:hypothetical protein
VRRIVLAACVVVLLAGGTPALAGGGEEREPATPGDRIEELQQELDSLAEDVEDLREPVEEFDLFDQCMYLIGVTQHGKAGGKAGYVFQGRGRTRRPALAFDIRGTARAQFELLAFPGEEPPSIECNEDAGEEDSDD